MADGAQVDFLKGSTSDIQISQKQSALECANNNIIAILDFLSVAHQKEEVAQKLPELLRPFTKGEDKDDCALRIPYKQITVYINNILHDSDENLTDKMTSSLTIFCDDTSNNGYRRLAAKILDHIDLALAQANLLNTKAKALSNSITNMEKSVSSATKDVAEIKKSIYSQIMSIVAIFTGIAFVLFGGVSAISGLSQVVQSDTRGFFRALSFLGLFSLCMLASLYLFFRFVMAITDHGYGDDKNLPRTMRLLSIAIIAFTVIFGVISFFCENPSSFEVLILTAWNLGTRAFDSLSTMFTNLIIHG